MPYNVRGWFERYYHIFYIAFIVIWVTGIAGFIISPIIEIVSSGIIRFVAMVFGVPIII